MAKSSRSSIKKTNKTRLKSRVFGPKEQERTQRLSAKLVELASQPKQPSTMDIEQQQPDPSKPTQESKENSKHADDNDGTAMDVDGAAASEKNPMSRNQEKKRKESKSARIEKKRHRKAKNSITFAKKRTPAGKSTRK